MPLIRILSLILYLSIISVIASPVMSTPENGSISPVLTMTAEQRNQAVRTYMDLDSEGRKAYMNQIGLLSETEMVEMRDGTRLSTTYTRLPFLDSPAILIRTPYDKEDLEPIAFGALLYGYATVIQDSRGRYASDGEDMVFRAAGWGELQDGYDTVEWIEDQRWSNGKVGMWGYSAMGITSAMAAAAVPPSLVCMVPGFASSKGWGQTAYQGGVFRRELVEGWLVKRGSAHALPIFLMHPTNDSFWEQYNIESRYPLMKVPALHIGGWYDCFLQGTIHHFNGLQMFGAAGAQGNQRMIIGPWTHTNEQSREQGQLVFPQNSAWSLEAEIEIIIDFFNYWMKGNTGNGAMDGPPVQYYVMGDVTNPQAPGNVWKRAETWPPAMQNEEFFLQPNGGLSRNIPPASNPASEMIFDPSEPIPTIGGFNLEIPAGPFDQAPLLNRPDVIEFTSEPLEQPLEITGQVLAVLYSSTNLSDMDLTVRLADVYPDGRSILLCDGILRASFRESDIDPTPIEPGQIYRYTIDCWSTSTVIDTGHRIQVIIANANYPRFDLNPVYSTLKEPGGAQLLRTNVYHQENSPSHIVLPVVSGLDDTNVRNWWRW